MGSSISFQNYAADKLDWYLRPSAALDVEELPSGDYRARLTMSVRVPLAEELPDASPYILGPDPDGHGVFLTVHLPTAARDITTPDPSGFTTKGLDPPMQVRTFLDDVDGGTTLTHRLDFTLPRAHRTMLLLPSARLQPLPITIDGLETVDDTRPAPHQLARRSAAARRSRHAPRGGSEHSSSWALPPRRPQPSR